MLYFCGLPSRLAESMSAQGIQTSQSVLMQKLRDKIHSKNNMQTS